MKYDEYVPFDYLPLVIQALYFGLFRQVNGCVFSLWTSYGATFEIETGCCRGKLKIPQQNLARTVVLKLIEPDICTSRIIYLAREKETESGSSGQGSSHY